MGLDRTPIHHEFLGCHSWGHSLVLLELFLSVFVCVVFFNESGGWLGQYCIGEGSGDLIRTLCPGQG